MLARLTRALCGGARPLAMPAAPTVRGLQWPSVDFPDITRSARDLFNIDSDLQVQAFSVADEHVPPVDPDYVFDRDTTLALLAGFLHNRRVLVQGRHGTGKSSHV